MNTLEPIINALGKYSWRSFVGICATTGALLLFHDRLDLVEWYRPIRPWIWGAFFCSSAILMTYLCTSAAELWRKRNARVVVHFVPDGFNVGWSKQHGKEMNLRVGGTFTLTGVEEILMLHAFLAGTEAVGDLVCQIPMQNGSGNLISSHGLWLLEGVAQRTYFSVRLTPVVGTPGTTLRKKLMLRDNKNRAFSVGAVEFPFNGPPS